MGEIVFHLILMGGLGLFFKETFSINTARAADVVGPAGFPRGVIIVAMFLTGISLYKTVQSGLKDRKTETNSFNFVELNVRFLGVLVTIVIFIFLNNVLGFFLSSLVLIASVMVLLNSREKLKILLITCNASALFTIIFGRILSVPLPRGMGFIRNVSFLFY